MYIVYIKPYDQNKRFEPLMFSILNKSFANITKFFGYLTLFRLASLQLARAVV